jgi:hypothetical protein
MFYDEGSSLNLDLIIQNYEDERRRYWGDGGQTRNFLALVDQLAMSLLRGSQDLIAPSNDEIPHAFSWEQVRFLTDLEGFQDRVLERLEIDVAWVFCAETRPMAYRCLELANLVVSAKPNAAVVRFLRRLTRCYIAGFFPECIILCRSVFESAMKEKIHIDQGMRSKINHAKQHGWLTEDGSKAADWIWQSGNIAVHENPEATEDTLEMIRLTTLVLGELYAGRPDGGEQ